MIHRARPRSLGSALALTALAMWAAALLLAIPAGINDGPVGACVAAGEDLVFFGSSVLPESIAVRGAWQLFPLGVECSYIAPSGESLRIEPDILPTVVASGAALLTLLLVVVVVRDRRSQPRRHDDLRRA